MLFNVILYFNSDVVNDGNKDRSSKNKSVFKYDSILTQFMQMWIKLQTFFILTAKDFVRIPGGSSDP